MLLIERANWHRFCARCEKRCDSVALLVTEKGVSPGRANGDGNERAPIWFGPGSGVPLAERELRFRGRFGSDDGRYRVVTGRLADLDTGRVVLLGLVVEVRTVTATIESGAPSSLPLSGPMFDEFDDDTLA